MPHKTVFLDRDGTIMQDAVYSVGPNTIVILPGVIAALKRLLAAGWKLVIITNQSGVSRGTFTETDLNQFHQHLRNRFAQNEITFEAIYYCPHQPEDACNCRKPFPGMLLQAAREHNLDLPNSWMIGDRPADIGAGQAASCRTIRVLSGAPPQPGDPAPDHTAPDLAAAAEHILNQE